MNTTASNAYATNHQPFANPNRNSSRVIALGESVFGYGLLTVLFSLFFGLLSLLPNTVLRGIYGIQISGFEVLIGSVSLGLALSFLTGRALNAAQH
jgi:hypothetical protein